VIEIVRLHLARMEAFNGVPVHGFVLKHPRAGAILVDTGVGDPTEELMQEYRIVNRHVADALEEHQLSPADVRIVINTHLHFDHCGQNAVFKHAPFYVQRAELKRAREAGEMVEWFDFAGARFELLDGDADIAEGVRVVATPGHTIGHQSVIVDTGEGDAVMIGDAAYTPGIYKKGAQADTSMWPGQYSDRDTWVRSLDRLHAMHAHAVHFCHDTRVFHE